MNKQDLIDKIHEDISNSKLEDALKALKNVASDSDTKNEILILLSNLNDLKRERLLNIEEDRLLRKKQNKISLGILEILNEITTTESGPSQAGNELEVLEEMLENLEINTQTFIAQSRIRNSLRKSIEERLPDAEFKGYQRFFSKYYDSMTDEEKRMHKTIRGYTQNVIKEYNYKVLEALKKNSDLDKKIKRLKDLEKHLIIWKSKYESNFEHDETVSLIYIGVQERVPFPKGIENEIREYIEINR